MRREQDALAVRPHTTIGGGPNVPDALACKPTTDSRQTHSGASPKEGGKCDQAARRGAREHRGRMGCTVDNLHDGEAHLHESAWKAGPNKVSGACATAKASNQKATAWSHESQVRQCEARAQLKVGEHGARATPHAGPSRTRSQGPSSLHAINLEEPARTPQLRQPTVSKLKNEHLFVFEKKTLAENQRFRDFCHRNRK